MCIAVLFSPFGYAESNWVMPSGKPCSNHKISNSKKAGVIKHQQHSTQKQCSEHSQPIYYLARPALSASSQANQIRINTASVAELQIIERYRSKKS